MPIIEGPAPFLALLPSSSPLALPSSITLAHLVANAALAFSLNVLALVLIQRLGSLVMSLAGVGKDILIIAGAAVVFGTVVTPMQLCGPSLSAPSRLPASRAADGEILPARDGCRLRHLGCRPRPVPVHGRLNASDTTHPVAPF